MSKCNHADLRYRIGGKALVCESCKADAETIIAELLGEVASLRALCAARPSWPIGCSPEFHAWMDTIDAAGRGEGTK